MADMRIRAYKLVVRVVATRALVLLAAAGTVRYWQAWLMLGINAVGEAGTTHYLLRHDRTLLLRRMQSGADAELNKDRTVVQVVLRVALAGVLVVAGLDHRYGWSQVAPRVSLLADVAVAAGLVIVWLTFRANSFASSIVEVNAEQKVISTGPYALVRHPMYAGMVVTLAGMAPALGSWCALVAVGVFVAAIVVRLTEEEQFLARNLVGYADYRAKVRHRLAPLVW
jgi:protein-S-isoprenylcysteine O-methyltransferase Ste14